MYVFGDFHTLYIFHVQEHFWEASQTHYVCTSFPHPHPPTHTHTYAPPDMEDTTLRNSPLEIRKTKTVAYHQAEGTGSKPCGRVLQLHPSQESRGTGSAEDYGLRHLWSSVVLQFLTGAFRSMRIPEVSFMCRALRGS